MSRGEEYAISGLAEVAEGTCPFSAVAESGNPVFHPPGDMPARIAGYSEKAGQGSPQAKGEPMRCLLEGLALKCKRVLERLEDMPGRRLNRIRILGGGSQNTLLLQLIAHAASRLVYAGPVEAAATGNVLVQAPALGFIKSHEEVRTIMGNSFEVKPYEPVYASNWENSLRAPPQTDGINSMKEKIVLAWSGGKDSALALYMLVQKGEYAIAALLSTVTEGYDRVSMHGVRRELLERQASALGFSLDTVFIPQNCTSEEYERRMAEKMISYKEKGIRKVAFGDIFLQDVREYRERNLAKVGMEAEFPLWGRDSGELARRFIKLDFKAVITCVDGERLTGEFVGKEFDENFLSSLPSNIDPSGENGEFHTFVYAGPLFKRTVSFQKGEIILRENRFYFCDLMPISKEEDCK